MGGLVEELNQTAPAVETVGVRGIPQQQLLVRVITADRQTPTAVVEAAVEQVP
jgi:hypothetical protein